MLTITSSLHDMKPETIPIIYFWEMYFRAILPSSILLQTLLEYIEYEDSSKIFRVCTYSAVAVFSVPFPMADHMTLK